MKVRKSRTILIVDDDIMVRTLMRKILEGAGYEVFEAASAPEGIEQAKRVIPHAVLCDILMVKSNGLEFLVQKKKIPEIAAIPVLMVSSIQDKKVVYAAYANGAIDYITKPFEARNVIQKLAKLFHLKEFLVRAFTVAARPRVKAKVTATIAACSEGGFILEAPVRITEGQVVDVRAAALTEIEAHRAVLRRSERAARIAEGGLFYNDIVIAGVTPEMLNALRKNVRGW